MKTHKNSIIIISIVSLVLGFWIFGYIQQKRNQNLIQDMGFYHVAIVKDKEASKGGIRYVYSSFYFHDKKFDVGYSLTSQEFYKSHKIGDTIIIKILPNNPEESMIVEDKKYKPCYGVAPEDGWEELPVCE